METEFVLHDNLNWRQMPTIKVKYRLLAAAIRLTCRLLAEVDRAAGAAIRWYKAGRRRPREFENNKKYEQ
jgi:hypothetical protein